MKTYRDKLILFVVASGLLLAGLSPILSYLNQWRAHEALEERDYQAARSQYVRARLLTPKDPEVWRSMAYAEWKLEKYDAAAALFARAVELDPDDIDSRRNRAIMLERGGRVDEAIEALEQAREEAPDEYLIWQALAQIYARTGDVPRAIATLEETAERFPKRAPEAQRRIEFLRKES